MARDIRIIVLGKANLMREGLWALLSAKQGFEVLAVLEADAAGLESASVTPPPEVAVVHFAVLTARELIAIITIRRRWPNIRVLALTSWFNERLFGATTEPQVDGCLLESDSHTELFAAIRAVSRGERYLAPSISLQGIGGADNLTHREKEVMRLIAAGYPSREIARRLSLSIRTIGKDRARLKRKLGLRSAAAVAAYAIAHGYL
jgi:two-component system, NarL family, response regulator NreC